MFYKSLERSARSNHNSARMSDRRKSTLKTSKIEVDRRVFDFGSGVSGVEDYLSLSSGHFKCQFPLASWRTGLFSDQLLIQLQSCGTFHPPDTVQSGPSDQKTQRISQIEN